MTKPERRTPSKVSLMLSVLVLASCSPSQEGEADNFLNKSTPEAAAATAQSTETSTPTPFPLQSQEPPAPTTIFTPTDTPSPEPSRTPTAVLTPTPSPEPSPSAQPTSTQEPTNTPEPPTQEPLPTLKQPTATLPPAPTKIPPTPESQVPAPEPTQPANQEVFPPEPVPLPERTHFRKTGEAWLKLGGEWSKVSFGSPGDLYNDAGSSQWRAVGRVVEISGSTAKVQFASGCESDFSQMNIDRATGVLCGSGTFELANRVVIRWAVWDRDSVSKLGVEGTVADIQPGDIGYFVAPSEVFKAGGGHVSATAFRQ